MKKLFMSVALLILVVTSFAQTPGYEFTTVVSHQATPVKDQGSTGTCWCFATASFMESELLRMGKGEYDLSEMFIVRQKYMNQMEDNYLRRGKGSIGEGSLAHTFKNAYKKAGIVPEEVYTGLPGDKKDHNHGALSRYLKALVDANIESKKRTLQFDALINNLFDIYLGKVPEKFTYKGKEYTPQSFTESLGLNMDDYVELTSFTHKPYYETFSPEVPDNWENQPMYNLPLDELIGAIDYALNKAVAAKTASLVKRVGGEEAYMMTGGVAQNKGLVKTLEERLGTSMVISEKSQLCGALGAALFATDI